MAVTVLTQPTSPNATKTKLVYSITGSNVNQPQYQYVTDIYVSGSSDLLTRLYTYPNLQGSGIVDVARVLDDNLDYDKFWLITGSVAAVESKKTFDIRFGESYGTSISSSVTIYTGSTPNYIEVFPGVVDAASGNFNFVSSSVRYPSGSFAYFTNSPGFWPLQAGVYPLTNPFDVTSQQEIIFCNSSDFMTVTTLKDTTPQSDNFELIGYKLESGSIGTDLFNYYLFGPTISSSFCTFGVGPQNLALANSALSASLADPNGFNIYESSRETGEFIIVIQDKWDGIKPQPNAPYGDLGRIKYLSKPCNDEYTRFAWINSYGFWDYYNVYNPTRKVVDVNRKIYEQNYVDYSSNTSIYSSGKRGETQYNTGYTDRFEITTDYIPKDFSDWLTELFDSPDVYIQSGSNFIPIVITNTSYDWNMNENRQKLFQYTIQYELANKRYDR